MTHSISGILAEALKLYSGRVRERAEARIEAYLKEHEEEEKAKRIAASPGGLGRHQIYNGPLEFSIYQVK